MSDQTIVLPRPRISAARLTIASVAGVIAFAALRIAVLLRYRIDSDETQHLHVVWGWTHGLVQYRDLFDNHMPLFHILSIPLLLGAGERPEALIAGRMAMLPLFGLIALLTYCLAASCNDPRPAAWAAALGTLAPAFFLCSVEFRPDVLWTAFWLAALATLVGGPVTPRRAAGAGLFLGLAAAVSAKTSLLAASLGVAALVTFVLTRDRSLAPREIAGRIAAFIGAALVPLSVIAAGFAAIGAWRPFVYCTLTFNLVSPEHPQRTLFIFPSAAIIALAVRRILRDDVPLEVRRRRLFLFLAASVYGASMLSFWPIIEREHWLPFYPALAAGAVPLLWRTGTLACPDRQECLSSTRIAMAIVAVELLFIAGRGTPWIDGTVPSTAMIEQTMRLTSPAEQVVDLKGELLFRRRATYAVFEKITKKAISTGRLPDTIAADVLRTRAMVAVPDHASFPRRGRAFLLRNFVDVGSVRAAGMLVPRNGAFAIELPAEYSVVSASGPFHGTLDGTPYLGPRFLAAGSHTLVAASPGTRNAVLWSRAAAQGLTPFLR